MFEEKLALTQQEIMNALGIGNKKFKNMNLPFILLGKQKKYLRKDLDEFLESIKQGEGLCPSREEKAQSSIGIPSQLMVNDFETQQEQLILKKQKPLKLK
ncbi:MAG: hypothetical protein RIC95_09400 [Vicingaceae bacterium]